MMTIPEPHELIAFFECDPVELDPGIPWCYNRVSFETIRSGSSIHFEMEPGSGIVRFTWHKDSKEVAKLAFNQLSKLAIYSNKSEETLLLTSSEDSPTILLKLRLKPEVCIELTSWHEFP
jgi:hypothetical protein